MAHDKYYAICENKCLVDITHLEHKRGEYIGNGKAAERRIEISGHGNNLMITSANGMALVTSYGAICKTPDSATVSGLSWNDVQFLPDDNTLKLTTTASILNATGGMFKWERF